MICKDCDYFKRCEGFNIKGICENPEIMRRFTQADYICEKDENS